jgi:hypothetical protein
VIGLSWFLITFPENITCTVPLRSDRFSIST